MCVNQWRIQEFSSTGQKPAEAQNYDGQDLGKVTFSKYSAGEKQSSKIFAGDTPLV